MFLLLRLTLLALGNSETCNDIDYQFINSTNNQNTVKVDN